MTPRSPAAILAMRLAAALVVVALAAAVIAGFLGVRSQVSRPTQTGEEIWSATRTAGVSPIGGGYTREEGGRGSLSVDTVTLGGHTFPVTGILERRVGPQRSVGLGQTAR